MQQAGYKQMVDFMRRLGSRNSPLRLYGSNFSPLLPVFIFDKPLLIIKIMQQLTAFRHLVSVPPSIEWVITKKEKESHGKGKGGNVKASDKRYYSLSHMAQTDGCFYCWSFRHSYQRTFWKDLTRTYKVSLPVQSLKPFCFMPLFP